jgi:hypothetical protein
MPQGTIQSATPGNQWGGKFGTFIDYTVQLDNGGPFTLARKVKDDGSHKPVEVGSVLNYEVKSTDQYGTKIKEVNPEFAGQSNGNGAAPSGGGSDQRQDSIERQTAAKCAAPIIASAVASGKLPLDKATGSFDKLTNEFHKTIRGYTVEQPASTTPPLPTADVPADTEGIDTPAPGDDDEIPF